MVSYLSVHGEQWLRSVNLQPIKSNFIYKIVQGSAKRLAQGLVNFVLSLACHSCLSCLQHSHNLGTTLKPSPISIFTWRRGPNARLPGALPWRIAQTPRRWAAPPPWSPSWFARASQSCCLPRRRPPRTSAWPAVCTWPQFFCHGGCNSSRFSNDYLRMAPPQSCLCPMMKASTVSGWMEICAQMYVNLGLLVAGKKNPFKFSDTGSVRADGLCIRDWERHATSLT